MKASTSQSALIDNVRERIPAGLLGANATPPQIRNRARDVVLSSLLPAGGTADFLTTGIHLVSGPAVVEASAIAATICSGGSCREAGG